MNIQTQKIFFSATFTDEIVNNISSIFNEQTITAYRLQKEALKLKGVKNYRMYVNSMFKMDELCNIYTTFDMFQTMIFVFKKEDAIKLKEFLN